MDDSAEEGDEEEAEEGDEEDDEDKPKVVKRRKRVAEEEEEDVAEPISSQPSIIPRLINFEIGDGGDATLFAFNAATQQKRQGRPDGLSARARELPAGVAAERLVSDARHRRLVREAIRRRDPQRGDDRTVHGLPASTRAAGASTRATRFRRANGSSMMPAVGYGRIGADLERTTPTVPGMCTSTSAAPCFADINATYLSADLHIRVGSHADGRAVAGGRLPAGPRRLRRHGSDHGRAPALR